ncbi:Uncharacterized protein APZ42_015212 [Daphnia magna]|uniref:Uncharacterized protein n=1 Tax=Daphnia magna TaxID=35525 RepID=A0A162P9I4_9CRUS|nr:Uncharacterized protein APZ42_015212 [Daphnia magna]
MDDQPMQGLCSGGTVRERKERGCSKPHNDRHNLHKISNTKFQNKRVEEVFFLTKNKIYCAKHICITSNDVFLNLKIRSTSFDPYPAFAQMGLGFGRVS